ncbi:MAG: insulinase family protein [Ignavibacteriales bacterium]|nr:MAG: insulinase family protein [Ignavibacteriales bacterium]
MKTLLYIFIVLSIALYPQVDRTKPPVPGPAPEIKIGSYEKFELKNGLKVFVVKNDKLPVISVSLSLDIDPILEKDKTGYISAAGMLLRTGTKNRSKDRLDEEIDKIGATISTSSGGVYGYALKKHAETLFDLISDITINANFTQQELAKIKQMMQSNLAASLEEPDAIADRVMKKLYYGEGHPYAEYETAESVDKFTLDDCKSFYETYFRPQTGYMAIVGDITLAEAKKLAEKYFAQWQKKDVPKHTYKAPEPPKSPVIAIVNRDNAVQTNILVGHPVQLSMNSPDVIKARVTNTILGGGTFRLFLNLREKNGWTYGAYSSLNNDRLVGSFAASANVRNEVTDSAITEILNEMKRIGKEPVPEKELQMVKNYISGSFAISLESPQTVANFAINTERYKLSKDYFRNYLKSVAAVKPADISAAAKKYILADRSYIILVGKADEILEKVQKFSTAPVLFYDELGNRIEKTKPAGDEAVLTGEDIIRKYIQAIGGADNIMKVQDKTVMMQAKIQNYDISAVIYQKAPDKMLQKFTFAGMDQVIVYDGEKAFQKSMMGEEELTGDNLEMMQFEAGLHNILRLSDLGVTIENKGLDKAGGKDAWKIEITMKGGAVIRHFYDKETGLRLREERTVDSPQGKITQSTDLSDYKEVNGVLYPHLMKQNAGGMTLELKITAIQINAGIADSVFKVN